MPRILPVLLGSSMNRLAAMNFRQAA